MRQARKLDQAMAKLAAMETVCVKKNARNARKKNACVCECKYVCVNACVCECKYVSIKYVCVKRMGCACGRAALGGVWRCKS